MGIPSLTLANETNQSRRPYSRHPRTTARGVPDVRQPVDATLGSVAAGTVEAAVRAARAADLDQAAPQRRPGSMQAYGRVVRGEALFSGDVGDGSLAQLDLAHDVRVFRLQRRDDGAHARANVRAQLELEARLTFLPQLREGPAL